MLYPAEQRATKRIIDLGCLEGGYAVAFARAGFEVLGLEARSINFAKCLYVASKTDLPNMTFVQDDVRNLESYGTFDVVFCSGLLQHLDNPVDFIRTMSRCTRRALILNTHYAALELPPRNDLASNLSPMTTHLGVSGRWYQEYTDDATQEVVEGAVWSAWGNARSFWIEKYHLLQALREAGFPAIYEQYDHLDHLVKDIGDFSPSMLRGTFIAVKE